MSWHATYKLFSRMMEPFADMILRKRVKSGKENLARIGERKGIASIARPAGTLVWMHGASVGETSMLLPLITRLLKEQPDLNILVTSGTQTSAKIMAERLPERAIHQMMPMDIPSFVKRFLIHWTPDLAIWAESEIWPNLVLQTKASGAKMALINARLSEKSLGRWLNKRAFATSVFGCFDVIIPADQRTYDGLSHLSNSVVSQIGNLKSAMPALDFDAEDFLRLKTAIGDRPVWLAASTHAPEEADILAAHTRLRKKRPNALLLLMPRHPERGADIAAKIGKQTLVRRSLNGSPDSETSIYMMDTLGEMGLALALADVAFVGGSLDASLTGHNPLEPARAGIPILTGPHFASFTDIYEQFFAANAAMRVTSATQLAKALIALLGDGAAAGQMATRARSVAQENHGILEFTATHLQALLAGHQPS